MKKKMKEKLPNTYYTRLYNSVAEEKSFFEVDSRSRYRKTLISKDAIGKAVLTNIYGQYK